MHHVSIQFQGRLGIWTRMCLLLSSKSLFERMMVAYVDEMKLKPSKFTIP